MQGLAWLGTLGNPVVEAVELDAQRVALGARVVSADLFDAGAITAGTLFGDNYAEMRLVFGAEAGKTDFECQLMCLVTLRKRFSLGKA